MKKRTLFFLSVCAVALNGYVVHADSLEAPSQLVTVPNLPGIGGQLAVVEEAGQMKAVLSNITGEIVGVTGQFKSETNTGKTIAFTIDASGQYVAYLDRTSFSNEDQAFTLSLTANLIDGSAHNLDDYSFNWVKVAENTNDDSNLIENTNATEASKPVSSGTVVDSVEKDSSSSASETQSSSTASSSLAATVTDSSNVTSASTLTSTQTTSSVGSQLRSASLMRIATNSSAQSSAVTKASQIDQTLELKYTGSINSDEVIKFAVWSDENGQDDIVWYNADQTGAAYADLRKHRNYGKYNIHTYVNRNGKMVYLDAITLDVREPLPKQKIVKISEYKFEVIISDVPNYFNGITVPTWTNLNNQDDIKWYEGVRQSDGSYKVSVDIKNHNYETGLYLVHSYGILPNKQLVALAQTTHTVPKPQIKQTITQTSLASFDVVITGVPNYYTRVQVPTWTNLNNQDDIKWYEGVRQSDGSYKISVDIKNHNYETGLYLVHSYGVLPNKQLVPLAQTTYTVPQPQIKQTITQTSLASFDVVITGVPNYYTRVQVPTWTNLNNQDDIKWYEGVRQSDGSYKVSVDINNHNYETGLYLVHSYGVLPNKQLVPLAQTTYTVPQPQIKQTITQTSLASFDVVITGVPNYYTRVLIPTWTNYKDQDDIKWYEGVRQSDGSYKVSVDINNHNYETGLYHVHAYGVLPNKKLQAIFSATHTVSAFDIAKEQPSARSYTIYIDPGHGGVDSGASYGGVYEKNLALSVANKLKANLIQLGYQVLMTRTADYNVDFKTERSKMANQSNADLFISIHFNATGLASSNTTGIETYWYQYDPEYQPKINAAMHNDPTRLAESEILANQVHTSLISETGAVNRGVRRDTFAVLRETAIPAILVELGFMSNPSDLQKIKEDAYQTKLANALAQGIDNWYGAVGSKPTSGTSIQKKSTQQSQMTTSQQSFFNNILPAIQQVSQKNSIVTSVMLAQSILESGWGTSQLATNAYNIFGIKADSSWKGNTYTVHTKEVVNGKTITFEKQFRAYKSLLESISDYGSFFTSTAWRMKNYASFLQATNYETALTSLLASGYATDPAYAEKLKSLIQRYGLDQYDLN
ncbi:GBS Bsp-like repeat-containing protein [Streptococcus parasuis]|uniref:GBS Bsp-like repeat-containing protein n=1 Tax=Streptococcus parasuis TaxID=1501662 RepID=UPI00289FC183|nr:GBS Bsp-like repeat-containing protein [Streptococcus parasuis]